MRRKAIVCVLCADPQQFTRNEHGVCNDCLADWKLGQNRAKLKAAEGENVKALVEWYPHMKEYNGDVEGPVDLHWTDIAAAMGAVSLRGSNESWGAGNPIEIGGAQGRTPFGSPSQELVEVPAARAKAMKKILAHFFNGLAKAHADGVAEGSNLLGRLARGDIKTAEFDEVRAAAQMQKRKRR